MPALAVFLMVDIGGDASSLEPQETWAPLDCLRIAKRLETFVESDTASIPLALRDPVPR
jgi:hypothetical protein